MNPAQRAALDDKVQAHWEVWRKVNHEAEPGGREKGGRLAMLIEELALTTDQSDKIAANLHTAMAGLSASIDPKEVEAHVQAFSTAFASDAFDAKTLGAGAAPTATSPRTAPGGWSSSTGRWCRCSLPSSAATSPTICAST